MSKKQYKTKTVELQREKEGKPFECIESLRSKKTVYKS